MFKKIQVLLMIFSLSLLSGCGCTVVQPGTVGVKVSLGDLSPNALPAGLQWHAPAITTIHEISIQQQTKQMKAECYSSDLQQVNAELSVLYRVPTDQVITLYSKYSGEAFESLVAPRVAEALKEITATQNAESIVHNREKIKQATLVSVREKIGNLIVIEDVVIQNITLSKELESAIESKMVQQQEAAKAEFTKNKAVIEAETALIRAQGEANAIKVRATALRDNAGVVDLMIAEKWNGVAPLVVGAGHGANVLLPIGK